MANIERVFNTWKNQLRNHAVLLEIVFWLGQATKGITIDTTPIHNSAAHVKEFGSM